MDTALANAYAVNDKAYKPEVDLMKLVIHKPTGPATVTLSFTGTSAQRAKVWERPTKETQVNLPKQYTVANMPAGGVTVWIEATNHSDAVQDIGLKLAGPNSRDDFVKATAAWVEKTTRPANQGNNPWCTRQAADGWPDNPRVGEEELPDCDLLTMISTIEGYKAKDGSRYGLGDMKKANNIDTMYGGRILYEFKLFPPSVRDLGVESDITRQRWELTYDIVIGEKTVNNLPRSDNWPWAKSPKQDWENPNDDDNAVDEDNFPTNQHLYSFDAPGNPHSEAQTKAFAMRRISFKEWARIRLDGIRYPVLSTNVVMGSRASDKYDWHLCMYLKRKSDNTWEEDNSAKDPSACAPTSHANGSLSVSVNTTNCDTEGWTVTYAQPNNQWDVKDAGGTNRGTLTFVAGSNPRRWTGNGQIGGNTWVTLTVTEAAGKTFANGDEFKFSTFKSKETTKGKWNDLGTGEFDVDGTGGTP